MEPSLKKQQKRREEGVKGQRTKGMEREREKEKERERE
jgi:hypothetical protein